LSNRNIVVVGTSLGGVEALQQLRNKAQLPNLVIVTWSFAQMACAEFIDQMKSEKRLAVIPIIVIASAISPEEVMQAYDAGAACVLLKGSHRESLIESLRSLKDFWSLVMLPFCNAPIELPESRTKTRDKGQISGLTSPELSAKRKNAARARWAKARNASESSE